MIKDKIIAFDIMGADLNPIIAIKAAIKFAKKNKDFKLILVGQKKYIKDINTPTNIEFLDSKNVVKKSAKSISARNQDTSMSDAIKLVKENKANAVLSSGSSAAYITNATLILRRIQGIKRPAFMPVFPTKEKGKNFVLLDVGANLRVDETMLYQWGKLGVIFSKNIFGIKNPKVGLLNIGTEDEKGFDYHKNANALLKKDKKINYKGFVESRNLLEGTLDVVISDGYAGNIALKAMEGTARTFSNLIKKKLMSNPLRILGAFLSKGAFNSVKKTFDYRNVGGAWVIGVKGIAIKAHGSSDIKSYIGALNQVKIAIQNKIITKLEGGIYG